jgi:hypothetical protein
VAALGVVGATTAFGADGRERAAATEKALEFQPRPAPASGDIGREDAPGRVSIGLPRRVNCRTVRCVKRALSQLNRAVNTLNFETFNCEALLDLTQYFGYEFDNQDGLGTFLTTALDQTEPGHPVNARALVYIC